MQKRRRDDEEEVDDERGYEEKRRQNGISNWMASILIPYSDAHSINIQLHRDHVALSILLPFRILSPPPLAPAWLGARCTFMRMRSPEGNGLTLEDSTEREEAERSREEGRKRKRMVDGGKRRNREEEGTERERKGVRVPTRHCI